MSFRHFFKTVFVFCIFLGQASTVSAYELDDEHKPKHLAVLNYLTGWSLDSAGYHPAVYMLLENVSGKDLSGVTIKMQGKFTDIHTLEPSTAKIEIRRSLKPHQQFPVALVSPKEHELPRDTNFWPVMECKAMMRVGSVGDEGTEYLLVTRVESSTQTQDDAFQKLNELTSYNRPHPQQHPRNDRPRDNSSATHTKPLVAARAEALKAASLTPEGKGSDYFNGKSLPGLGDDFYSFERCFGLPVVTDAKKKDYTWAKFKQANGAEVIVCSRERSGKADLVAFVLPKAYVKSEQNLIEQAKRFCGSLRNGKFTPVSKSVRYLPSGRQELVAASSPGLKIQALGLAESSPHPGGYFILVSRLGQEAYEFMHSHLNGNDVLKGLPLE